MAKKSQRSPVASDVEEDNGVGEVEEDEYDIEHVLDAKKGVFKPGQWAFLVKWLGYGEEDNSWVKPEDFGDQTLITNFWKDHPEIKGNPLQNGNAKRGRKSDVSSVKGGSKVSKDKPRKSKGGDETEDEVMEVDEEEAPPKKKSKSTAASKARSETPPRKSTSKRVAKDSDSDTPALTLAHEENVMDKYEGHASWESIVKEIDTVERHDDGELTVYFTTRAGEKAIATSEKLGERAPHKLLGFYESHLRWRPGKD